MVHRFIVFLCLLFLLFGYSTIGDAQNRGIGVSPAKIEFREISELPLTTPLFVTNFSSQEELFEVTFDGNDWNILSAAPGRFTLKAGETGRVLVTLEDPKREFSGKIRILTSRISPEGLATGTGIEVPVSISPQLFTGDREDFGSFLASIAHPFLKNLSTRMFGMAIIFVVLAGLWYLSESVKEIFFQTKEKSYGARF